jgi:hypothetical protein
MIDLRLRTRISDRELQSKVGKIVTPADWNLQLTGPAFVRKPDGRPLCVYLPGGLGEAATDDVYRVLHSLRGLTTDNRGLASGTLRVQRGQQNRTRTRPISSAIIGSFESVARFPYCRLTAWTGQNLPQWETLHPLLKRIAAQLAAYVPDRYAAQAEQAARTHPDWVVPGTPFTTVTVNNSYPTGVHTDKGDLDAGFSTIGVLRRGAYTGGQLCFPMYRIAVDLQDRDLILMDAHDWHGNAAMVCGCGQRLRKLCGTCGAERISLVAYFRTKVVQCGTADQETARAAAARDSTPITFFVSPASGDLGRQAGHD